MLTEWIDGALWTERRVPLTLLPTMDWRLSNGNRGCTLNSHTNRIHLCGLGGDLITAETRLTVPRACESYIKIICRNPIRVLLDGEEIICCDQPTAVIPAYHRADKRKCAKVALSAGEHQLVIEVKDGRLDTPLYCYVVDGPEHYWSMQIDKVFA